MVRRAKPVGAGHRWERGGTRSDHTRELKGSSLVILEIRFRVAIFTMSSFPSNDNGPVRNDIRQYKTFVPQLERPPTPKWDTVPNPDIRQNPFSDKVGFSFHCGKTDTAGKRRRRREGRVGDRDRARLDEQNE